MQRKELLRMYILNQEGSSFPLPFGGHLGLMGPNEFVNCISPNLLLIAFEIYGELVNLTLKGGYLYRCRLYALSIVSHFFPLTLD